MNETSGSGKNERTPVWELAALFLRLGATAFGGPAAHIALMRTEVVERRRWMTEAEFLDLLGATNLIPGPNSTELAIHIGYRRGGWRGLLAAGIAFILPAFLLVMAFAWAYVRFGRLAAVTGLLYAVKPVVVAVVVQAIWNLGKPALKSLLLGGLGIGALILALAGADELLVLFGAGLAAGVVHWGRDVRGSGGGCSRVRPLALMLVAVGVMAIAPMLWVLAGTGDGPIPYGLGPLFLFFLKVGAVLYGSGYVLLAFLRDGLVARWHWLTAGQLLDAVAVGQVTPGPVFTTATFIGYVVGGPAGALTATVGIFLPSFVFVAASGPIVGRIRESAVAGGFLDGVNVAALALMAAVTWQIGRAALLDAFTVAVALVSALLLVRFRVSSAWLIVAAVVIGIAAALAGWRG